MKQKSPAVIRYERYARLLAEVPHAELTFVRHADPKAELRGLVAERPRGE